MYAIDSLLNLATDIVGLMAADFVVPADCVAPVMNRSTLLTLFQHPADPTLQSRITQMIGDFFAAERVAPAIDQATIASLFSATSIPTESRSLDAFCAELADTIIPNSINTASPRFIGHMTSALPNFVLPMSQLMVALNQNLVKYETSGALSFCERRLLAELHQLVFRYDACFYHEHTQAAESTLGCVLSGGTGANISALWCARNRAFAPRRAFAGVEQDGLAAALAEYGVSRSVVIGSELMHYSFDKAVALLGYGTDALVRVPVDSHQRVDVGALRQAVAACIEKGEHITAIIGVAGSTDCGSIDPLEDLADIARETGAHFHVDAAWGGPLLFSRRHAELLRGIELADSVTIDGHKQLYQPVGIGMILFRDPHCAAAIAKEATYIIRRDSNDLGRRSLEGSRPGMSLGLYAALNVLGHDGFELLIDDGIERARLMAAQVERRDEFQLLVAPAANIVVYRYVPKLLRSVAMERALSADECAELDSFNQWLQEAQLQAGRTFVSRTQVTLQGQSAVALRAVFANPLTTVDDITAVLDDQVTIAACRDVLECSC